MEYINLMNKPLTASLLTVNTRRGPVTFETHLEWEEAINLCRQEAQKGNKFAYDLCMRETKGLFMSESQVSWVYKIAEDVLKLSEPKETKVNSVDASNILGSLAEARAHGLKKPALRLQMNSGESVLIKYMSTGKNAGGCWVTVNDALAGKIDDCGVFTSGHDRSIELFEFIKCTNSDVKGALESFGRSTSRCGCCGLPLTNKKSIELGIGPICLDKYGLLAFAQR